MQFKKISILPPQKGLEFPGGWEIWKIQKYKEMYEAFLEFPEGWGGVRKNLFCGGGMDIFWNYTFILLKSKGKLKCIHSASTVTVND